MGLLNFINGKPKITETAYDDIPIEHIALYQYFFKKIINFVDVNNYTNWAKNRKYDQARIDYDDNKMEEFVLKEFANTKLSTGTIQVMVNQYFFADEYRRESDVDNWVNRVLYRKDIDYFPSAWAVMKVLGME